MATVREGFGLVCSSVLVGVLYGFPVIGVVVAQLLGTGELVAAVEEPRFETRMIDTPMYAPEGDKGEDPIAAENPEPAKPARSRCGADPPPERGDGGRGQPVDSELVDVAVLGDAEGPPPRSAAKCLPITTESCSSTTPLGDRRRDRRLHVKHQPGKNSRGSVGTAAGRQGRRLQGQAHALWQRAPSGRRRTALIQSINGKSVHSIPTAISAYTKLRSKNVLRLTVSRTAGLTSSTS
jgi:hypothetical protein